MVVFEEAVGELEHVFDLLIVGIHSSDEGLMLLNEVLSSVQGVLQGARLGLRINYLISD